MTRVVYIIGWGRSGSTLLDTALGSFPGVVSTGELRYLWERGLVERRRCGCGERVPACGFWRAVLAGVERARRERGALPVRPVPEDVVELQQTVARTRHALGRVEQRSFGAWALHGLTTDLVRAVASEAGVQLVVDSSKTPADAALYLGDPSIELHLVHIVRDPRAVAHSWQRSKMMTDLDEPVPIPPQAPARSSTMWLAWNLLAERLAPHATTYQRVHYEDLATDPATVLRRTLAVVGQQVDPAAVVTAEGLEIAPNHTVAGNPSRFARGPVPVRLDGAWRTDQSFGQRWAATLPALPRMRAYGYAVRLPPRTSASTRGESSPSA